MNLITLLALYTLTVHIQEHTKEGLGLATCTAVYISPTEALTAAHCVEKTTGKIWVQNSDYKSFSATIERQDKSVDLCILKIQAPKHEFTKLGDPAEKGDKVYLMSSEEDMPQTYAEGIIENIVLDPTNMSLTVMHSASILPGASGSGLFNNRGRLIGINTAIVHGLSFAVDETVIETFLTGNYRH